MERFKTFVNSLGEYGIIEINIFDQVYVATSSTPILYPTTAELDELKNYFKGWVNADTQELFNWEEDVPKDWKFIEVELKRI